MSEALTERVLKAVAELHYVPSAIARSLSRGQTGLIGLLIPDIANPFFAEVARGLEDEAVTRRYQILIASSDLDPEREQGFVTVFESGALDAVVVTPSGVDVRWVRRLAATGLPFIFLDRRPRGIQAPLVASDNLQAARRAVRHLVSLGHRRVAMLSGPPSFETASERVRGFRAACREAGIDVEPQLVRQGYLGIAGGHRAMTEVLGLDQRPTATFAFNNLLTVGALGALRGEHVRVPADMSLVSFDDMSLFPFVDPPITAIAQPAYEIGRAAARLLFDVLERPSEPHSDIVLPTEFRLRSSTAAPSEPRRSRLSGPRSDATVGPAEGPEILGTSRRPSRRRPGSRQGG